MKNKIIYLLLFCTCLALPGQAQQFKTFEVGKKTFLLNGEPFIVKAADAERDIRGFAMKFYTAEGNWDW